MKDLVQNDPEKQPSISDGRKLQRLVMKDCPHCRGSYATRAICSDGSVIELTDKCSMCRT
jgi:hypothetical protein